MPQSEMLNQADAERERRIELLICRLPEKIQTNVRWLRRPQSRWARIPAAILFIIGGCLFFLPILGLWMLPLGLFLLADDVPVLKRVSGRILSWIEHKHPGWMGLGK